MQKISLIGLIGEDSVITTVDPTSSVLNFSVAVNKRYKEKNEWKQKAIWYRIAIWRNLESLNKLKEHITKGNKIYVAGDFETTVYNDQPQITVNAFEHELLTFNKK